MYEIKISSYNHVSGHDSETSDEYYENLNVAKREMRLIDADVLLDKISSYEDTGIWCAFCNEIRSVKTFDLAEHDKQVRADERSKTIDEFVKKAKDMQFHTGRAWFDFDSAIDRCVEIASRLKSVFVSGDGNNGRSSLIK